MRSLLLVPPLAALMMAGSAYAQQPAVERPCVARGGPPSEYLQKLARQYHPEALAPAAQHDSMVVGFVFDSTCQVVRHGVGRYGPDWPTAVDSALAKLFPAVTTADFSSSGVLSIAVRTPGHLMIMYAVLKRT